MKDKLALQDIVDLLAKKANLSKKEADIFFRELFMVIVDNVFNDEHVKIKDFGTFKLTKVSSRESVDVNTGGKIEIPAHYKISFLPDKSLKELVNKPFAQFEVAMLKDGVSFDIEESEEPVESSGEDDTAIDETAPKPQTQPEKQPETAPVASEAGLTQKPEKPAPQPQEKAKQVIPSIPQPFVYTYTSEDKEDKGNSITIVIPADKVLGKAIVDEKDAVSLSLPQESAGKGASLETNKVREKIDSLKDAIDSLSKVKTSAELSSDDNSGIEIESVTGEAEAQEPVEEQKINEPEVLPEDEDAVGELPENLPESEGLDKTAEEEESDEDYTNDYEYQDYYRETIFTRIRRKIPIIILLLVVTGIIGYMFYELFNEKNNYEIYKGYRNLTSSDSLVDEQNYLGDTVSLKAEDTQQTAIVDSLLKPNRVAPRNEAQAIQAPESSVNKNDTLKDASETPRQKFERIISENFKIAVVNKAAFVRNKGKNAVEAPVETPAEPVSNSVPARVEPIVPVPERVVNRVDSQSVNRPIAVADTTESSE
ncbi:HU family DNA-binding protein [Viscerimonas tarda]